VPVSDLGHGTTVIVRVQDTRPTLRIGYRGLDSKLAEITTDQDLAVLFQAKIIEGLRQLGFNAVRSSDEAARVLKVEIRVFEYTTDMEFLKGIIRAKAVLHAYTRTENFIFDQLYVAEQQQVAAEAPRASTNEKLINGAASDVLQRLLGDSKLVKFLAN
jgi:uncharacterized lipoprotein YajG